MGGGTLSRTDKVAGYSLFYSGLWRRVSLRSLAVAFEGKPFLISKGTLEI